MFSLTTVQIKLVNEMHFIGLNNNNILFIMLASTLNVLVIVIVYTRSDYLLQKSE